jgi:hypothetical protein
MSQDQDVEDLMIIIIIKMEVMPKMVLMMKKEVEEVHNLSFEIEVVKSVKDLTMMMKIFMQAIILLMNLTSVNRTILKLKKC